MTLHVMDDRELAAVLAGLRCYQHLMESGNPPRWFEAIADEIATDGGRFAELEADDIDALCERLNCRPSLAPAVEPAAEPVQHEVSEYTNAARRRTRLVEERSRLEADLEWAGSVAQEAIIARIAEIDAMLAQEGEHVVRCKHCGVPYWSDDGHKCTFSSSPARD